MHADLYDALDTAVRAYGLIPRGGFATDAADAVPEAGPDTACRTVILVGNAGADMWAHFAPYANSGPNPLDRWTVDVIEPIAAAFGARAVYPFDKPPLPFQRWALRAEPVHPSPLGVLIHPEYGLWHAYRAALLFAETIALPPASERPSPCLSCQGKPCLSACPVAAFGPQGYDVPACASHLSSPPGRDCLEAGCLARGACPVGVPYAPDQVRFHMRAFHRAVSGD
jgi:hypothetical protein